MEWEIRCGAGGPAQSFAAGRFYVLLIFREMFGQGGSMPYAWQGYQRKVFQSG